jgi:pimeloyl-ACP methyl ester carboxylesterase
MAEWTDRYWTSGDGLRLHYRDYDGPTDRPPILCLPGLTRNVRDFDAVADRCAGAWRVLAVDFRGRGLSAYDPEPGNYTPNTYAADVRGFLDALRIDRAILLGTSLGGIVTMILGASAHDRIAGAMLNDIGPEIDPRGIERIRGYVGRPADFASWEAAAAALAARNADVYPHYDAEQWEAFARRICVEREGRISFDYDMAIATNFNRAPNDAAPSMWPQFRALAGIPLLILRGELSDLLAAEVAQSMVEALPEAELVVVPGVGHAPALNEPEAIAGIDRLLARALAKLQSA